MIRALVPLADGVEEMEAVIIVDVLRRARWQVTVAGLDAAPVVASRGVKLVPDAAWPAIDIAGHDVLALPGGSAGAKALMADRRVLDAVRQFTEAGKLVGAICAAPLVLQAAGVLRGRRATCHPAVRDRLTEPTPSDDRVVVDGRIVTSQGPGTAFEFALTLIRLAGSPAEAEAVAKGLVL